MRGLLTPVVVCGALLAGCGGGSSSESTGTTGGAGATATATSAASAQPGSASQSNATTQPRAKAPPGVTPGATLASGFHLSSPAFGSGGAIPRQYTCDGRDVSLPLRWSGVPRTAQELVLVMRDPDAASGDFVHWAVAGIPPSNGSFVSGGVSGLVAPGRNSYGSLGYRGPCPPRGAKAHHYVLTLSALTGRSGLRAGFTADQLRTAAVGIATLVGTYARR